MVSTRLNPPGRRRAAKGSPAKAASRKAPVEQRGNRMVGERIQRFGVPWYRPEDWNRLVALFEDADTLPHHYDDWLISAEMVVHLLSEQGVLAEKVNIDPIEFPKWCASRGLRPNARARMRFAGEVAARRPRWDA